MHKTNIVGSKYGKLTVLALDETINGRLRCRVKCDCGNEKVVDVKNVLVGNTKTCGCSHRDIANNSIEMLGQRFGRLVVMGRSKSVKNRSRWLCQCDCGKTCTATGKTLRQGKKKSCGCIKREQLSLPDGYASRNHLLALYVSGAMRRDLCFKLTEDEFIKLTSSNCHYCNIVPSSIHKTVKANSAYLYNGIDRVDNDEGYTVGNCVSCCTVCNWMKRSMSKKDFVAQCIRVSENFKTLAEMTNGTGS